MIKKTVCFLMVVLFAFPLCGCWNYRGLDQMLVAIGVAIDKNPENGNYELSFEVVDLTVPIKEKGLSAKLIESEGKTIFDAVRNAKMRIAEKLYFGQLQIIVVSEDIVRNEDIGDIIDWFLRDAECRETMCFAISQEKTAREILSIEGIDKAIVSSEIQEILKSDKKVTSSTLFIELYQVFNVLNAKGKSLVLPAIHNVINDGELASEVNGLAVFKDEKLVGFLTPEESKYYLFAVDEIGGGVLTFSCAEKDGNGTLEISRSATKFSFDYQHGEVRILIKTDTTAYLGEFMGQSDVLVKEQIAAMEDAAEAELIRNIKDVIQKVQAEYDSDIFGFGNLIYKKDPKLWIRLSDNWDEQFKSLIVEVQSEIHIVNTATVKKS